MAQHGAGVRVQTRAGPQFESIGVDRIDETERTSTPWTFVAILISGSVGLGTIAFGWIPLTFGLGTQATLSAILVGTLLGLPLVAPMIVIGSRTATNNSTASGAEFGVRGRLVGSFIGLAIALVYTAVSIWAAGSATIAILARHFGTTASGGAEAATYAVITLIACGIAIYGYDLLMRASKVLFVLGSALVVLMLVAFAGSINFSYAGGEYLLGEFWSTWFLAVIAIGMTGPFSLVTIMGDWSRYISSSQHPPSRLIPVASIGILVALGGFSMIGTLIASGFADPYADFTESLVQAAPDWFVLPLLPLAFFGGLQLAAQSVYSGGLDLDSIFPRLSRAIATMIVSTASAALVFLGTVVWSAADSITSAVLVLTVLAAPWAAIVGVGYLRRNGAYHLDDLQVFNQQKTGGSYWYSGGLNARAIVAWTTGAGFGILTLQTGQISGPWAEIAFGIDVSVLGSFLIGGAAYLGLSLLLPIDQTATSFDDNPAGKPHE